MPRIGVLTDVHANLPALQAALAAIAEEGCDALIHTGDAIGFGPHPAECLDLLLSSGAEFVLGNHDAYFAFGLGDRPVAADDAAHHLWTHAQLDPALRDAVAAWPWEIWIPREIAGQWLLFTHYGREDGWFKAPPGYGEATSAASLDEVFAGVAADVVFYGHDHVAFDGTGDRRYVNPGSVGCFSRAEARFAIVDAEPGGVRVTHRSVPYDDGPVFEDLERREVPQRDDIRRFFLPRG